MDGHLIAPISANYMPGHLIGFYEIISLLFKEVMQKGQKRSDDGVKNITIPFM
jgi:hypothetical protein